MRSHLARELANEAQVLPAGVVDHGRSSAATPAGCTTSTAMTTMITSSSNLRLGQADATLSARQCGTAGHCVAIVRQVLCVPGRHELECRLFGRCRWLARLRHGYLAAVFALNGIAAREQLGTLGDMSGQDREVLAIDVQDGAAIGQQVLRPITHQALPRADMDPPLNIGRDPILNPKPRSTPGFAPETN